MVAADDFERRGVCLEGREEDLHLPELGQAPVIFHTPAQSPALCQALCSPPTPDAEPDDPHIHGSDYRNSGSSESGLDFRQSVYVDARDGPLSEDTTDTEKKRYSTGTSIETAQYARKFPYSTYLVCWRVDTHDSGSPQPSRRYTQSPPTSTYGNSTLDRDVSQAPAAFASLHPALGPISLPSRRHSSTPHADEVRHSLPIHRLGSVRLKPLVLTPARTLSTPLTTSGIRARQVGWTQGPSPSRRYSTPTITQPVGCMEARNSKSLPIRPEKSNASLRRRSIGYYGESPAGSPVIKRSGSTSSATTSYSSDFSRRGSADTCDTDLSDPSSSPEKFCHLSRTRLPSLQTRFDPQRGLNLDVVLETDDDLLEMPRADQEAYGPPARYQDFWGEEAVRNESAFQDVCVALDELAPAFPTSSLLTSRSFSPSASPLTRSGSSASDKSSSGHGTRRGKPIVIKPVSKGRDGSVGYAGRSRHGTRNRLFRSSEGPSSPLTTGSEDTATSPGSDPAREKPANAGPVSSADLAATTAPKRSPRPFVLPPPNETKRLSLAPVLAYDSEGDSDSLGDSGAESSEKAELKSRVTFIPRPPRTRNNVETETGDFLDFLLNESPTAPSTTTVLLDGKAPSSPASTRGGSVVSKSRSTARSLHTPAGEPPKPKGFAVRFLNPFNPSSSLATVETSPKHSKKRPTSFTLGRSKSAAPASATAVRPRPVISGPLELEASNHLHTTSSRESLGSVSTISLAQAQKLRSIPDEGRRVPLSPTTAGAMMGGGVDPDNVAEELLTLYTDIAPMSPPSVQDRAPASISSTPALPGRSKQLPAPPLLLSPLWALPVTDLPRTPLAWAEKPPRRSSSASSVATNGTTAALVDAYA